MSAQLLDDSPRLQEHRRCLLQARRCPSCAEPAAAALVLRGGTCPSCDRTVHAGGVDAAAVLEAVLAGWRRHRWPIYGLLALAQGAAGFIPFLQPLLNLVAMLLADHLVVRRPLRWISPWRRALVRLSLQLFMGILAVLNLLAHVVVLWVPGLNALVAALGGGLVLVLYVELALWLVGRRVRREARGPGLDAWEWALPGALVALVVGSCVAVVGAAWGTSWMLLQALEALGTVAAGLL